MSMPPKPKSVHTDHAHHAQPEDNSWSKKETFRHEDRNAAGGQALSPTEIHALFLQLSASIDRLEATLPPISKLATVPQAARCLGISPRTIRTQLYRGRWPGYRVGRAVRVDPAEIRKLMNKAFLP
jgi:excisionase family DNA binding protein